MLLSYAVFDPTKNITALVTAPLPRQHHAAAAETLMHLRPEVEQVGFLEPPSLPGAALRLQMMGGEFCGNAAMSAAAWLAERDGLPAGQSADVRLEVSGADHLVDCRVERTESGFQGTAAMPRPTAFSSAALPSFLGGVQVQTVTFPGIVHCIVSADALTRAQAEAARGQLPALCQHLRADACGILLYQEASACFTPLVCVKKTNTAVWESGCGSGSAAIGAAAALRACGGGSGSFELALRQPGGVIRVRSVLENGRFAALSISGSVLSCGTGSFLFAP